MTYPETCPYCNHPVVSHHDSPTWRGCRMPACGCTETFDVSAGVGEAT